MKKQRVVKWAVTGQIGDVTFTESGNSDTVAGRSSYSQDAASEILSAFQRMQNKIRQTDRKVSIQVTIDGSALPLKECEDDE